MRMPRTSPNSTPNCGNAVRGRRRSLPRECVFRAPGRPDVSTRGRALIPHLPALDLPAMRLLEFFPWDGTPWVIPRAHMRMATRLSALGLIDITVSPKKYWSGTLSYGRITPAGRAVRQANAS